jgi:hypothetical protein
VAGEEALTFAPVEAFPIYQLDQGEPFDLLAWYNLVGGAGYLLWLVAYVLVIRRGAIDRTYAIPFVAICLNFTWEAMDSFFLPDPVPFFEWVDRAWFLLDCAIVWQLVRYGKKEQTIPEIRNNFYAVVAGTMVLAFVGQYAFVDTFHDTLGFIAAFVINFVMSVLFVFFFFARRDDRRGLSLGAAWCKLLGTALASVQCVFLLPKIHPLTPVAYSVVGPYAFFHVLFVGILLVDGIYLYLLMRSR